MARSLCLALMTLVDAACGHSMDMPMADVPAVKGYAEGEEILFIHTEASDPMVAMMLTEMMDSRVFAVPSLGDAPDDALANVFVFKNGIVGMGPFGFQVDVFDSPPDTPGYRPLRRLNLVTWSAGTPARELKSVGDVLAAEASGELAIEQPGIVINMPIVAWPGGGKR